jgi:uncharacterized RDD family membrane protein YckC
MNQSIVNYLNENKEKYSQAVLVAELQKAGYPSAEIAEGVGSVYGASAIPALNIQPPPMQYASGQIVSQPHYAGFWIRLVAIFIDGLVLWLFQVIVSLLFGILAEVISGSQYELIGALISVLLAILAVLADLGYFIFMTYKFQATLGKMALGLRVYTVNLEKPTLGVVVGREFGRILSHISLLIGYIMAAFTEKKQALHDLMAGTVVVYKDSVQK